MRSKIRVAAVLGALFAALAPANSSAKTSGWVATSFESAQASVDQGDHVTVSCWDTIPRTANMAGVGGGYIYADVAFDSPSESRYVSQLAQVARDIAVMERGSAHDLGVNLRGLLLGQNNESPLWDFVAPDAGTARYAWATWGYESGCTMEVNGSGVDSTPSDPADATLFYGEDFDSSEGLSWAVRPLAQSHAHERMTRSLTSSTVLFMGDLAQTSDVRMSATTPSGHAYEVEGSNVISFRGTPPGAWTFEADGVSVLGDWPPLCLVQLPQDYLASDH